MISSSSSTHSADVGREFLAIWVTAMLIAAGFVSFIWRDDTTIYEEYPTASLPDVDEGGIVFIGSSLTVHLVPGAEPAGGVLGDQRPTAMLAAPGISERLTTRLLAHAIESGAQTVLVEINAYVHDYIEYSRGYLELGEPLFSARIARYFRELGARLTHNFKRLLLGMHYAPAILYKNPIDGGDSALDFESLASEEYYRLLPLEPAYPVELRKLLDKARSADTEVIFFSPPRPLSVVNLVGEAEFARTIDHLSGVAHDFGVPVWYSPSGWPDENFIDIKAHVNARGRVRFLHELASWYGNRQ